MIAHISCEKELPPHQKYPLFAYFFRDLLRRHRVLVVFVLVYLLKIALAMQQSLTAASATIIIRSRDLFLDQGSILRSSLPCLLVLRCKASRFVYLSSL
jgi:hypothetical protein